MKDIITCKSYQELCDFCYDAPNLDDLPDSGVIHVPMDQIEEFFRRIDGNGRKYIVVSSCSDFGLCYQREHPVWRDLPKALQMNLGPHIGYRDIGNIPARCDKSKCRETDTYSVKCYSWTRATFDKIPENVVRWYVTNSLVEDTRLRGIPFGIAPGRGIEFVNIEPSDQRHKLFYANWNLYTYERYILREKLRSNHKITVIDEAKPYEEYVVDLSEHMFVLCPNGNGVDCYRTLEAIYAGCIPIVEDNITHHLWIQDEKLPIILCRDFLEFVGRTPNMLMQIYDGLWSKADLSRVKLSYWQKQLAEERSLLWELP